MERCQNTVKDYQQRKRKKGLPTCWRCGSAEHVSRDCHLPYQPAPAFGPMGNREKAKVSFNCASEGNQTVKSEEDSAQLAENLAQERGGDLEEIDTHLEFVDIDESAEWASQWWEEGSIWTTNHDVSRDLLGSTLQSENYQRREEEEKSQFIRLSWIRVLAGAW